MIPKLQVALDYTDLDEANDMLRQIETEVDIVEAGTPLLKSEGMKSVLLAFSDITDKPLVADLKVADVADIEFNVAALHKAKYVTLLASSPVENVQDGIKAARENDLEVVADLIGVEDYCEKAKKMVELGIKNIGVHCGISEQREGKTLFEKAKEVSEAIASLDGQLVLAGGINAENMENLKGLKNVAIVIAGSGITATKDPVEAARGLKNKIGEVFSVN